MSSSAAQEICGRCGLVADRHRRPLKTAESVVVCADLQGYFVPTGRFVEVHEYLFDAKLFAAVRIRAPDEATARKQLAEVLDGADLSVCHGGVDMPDTFEASLDGELDLVEVDGEAAG